MKLPFALKPLGLTLACIVAFEAQAATIELTSIDALMPVTIARTNVPSVDLGEVLRIRMVWEADVPDLINRQISFTDMARFELSVGNYSATITTGFGFSTDANGNIMNLFGRHDPVQGSAAVYFPADDLTGFAYEPTVLQLNGAANVSGTPYTRIVVDASPDPDGARLEMSFDKYVTEDMFTVSFTPDPPDFVTPGTGVLPDPTLPPVGGGGGTPTFPATPALVPLPAGVWLLLAAFGSLGVAKRGLRASV